jgi:hypothetical protein
MVDEHEPCPNCARHVLKRKLFALSLLVSASLGVVGCSDYTCEEWCEDRSECSDSNLVRDQCDEECDQAARLNESTGCDDEFEEYLECFGRLDDVCDEDETSDCATDALVYLTCVLEYCNDHPNDADCTGTEEPPAG